jgi:hypothetical protein
MGANRILHKHARKAIKAINIKQKSTNNKRNNKHKIRDNKWKFKHILYMLEVYIEKISKF